MKIRQTLGLQPANLAEYGEEEACRYLKKNGCKIVERNFRVAGGEIDVVARCGDILIFCEVKTRMSSAFAQPWEAVGYRKRQRLKKAAAHYIREHDMRGLEIRFDVISITLDQSFKPVVQWIRSAF